MVAEFSQKTSDSFNELCGESSDINSETIEEWVTKLPSIIQGYEPENIVTVMRMDCSSARFRINRYV